MLSKYKTLESEGRTIIHLSTSAMLFSRVIDNNGQSSLTNDPPDTLSWGNNTSHQYANPRTIGNGWYLRLLNVGGPGQSQAREGVVGSTSGFLGLYGSTTAPASLYSANRMSPDEGSRSPFYPGVSMPTLPLQLATIPHLSVNGPPSPVSTLSRGSWVFPSNTYSVPADTTYNPRVVPNLGDLGLDTLTAAGSFTLPTVYPPSSYISSHEEPGGQIPDPSYLALHGTADSNPMIGVTPPGIFVPAPAVLPPGPQRTAKRAGESRKYNPVNLTNRKGDNDESEHGDDWGTALARFRAKLHNIVHYKQPTVGLSPEVALAAKTRNAMEEELKRSPLRDTKAGEGKRPRDMESYLTGLLREILPVKLAPVPSRGGSKETNTKVAVFASLADALEVKLVVVNQHPVLQCSTDNPQAGSGIRLEQTADQVKKNKREKTKRGCERHHLERISRLFKVAGSEQTWTRVDVLIFAVGFLLHGPSAFSSGFVKTAPVMQGL